MTVGLAVLRVLIESERPLYLREVAAGADMATSNAYKYLVSFGEAGLISQDAQSGRYGLGPLAIQLGLAAMRRVDALDIAIGVLADLVETTETDGHLCVCGTAGPTVVRWKDGPRDISVRVREGHVFPFMHSATGRVWAAFMAAPQLQPLLDREFAAEAARLGHPRAGVAQAFEERLAPIRKSGLSYSSSERREGIDALCAPVFDRDGRMILSITLLGTSGRFDGNETGRPAQLLRRAVEDISSRVGCGPVELARYPWTRRTD